MSILFGKHFQVHASPALSKRHNLSLRNTSPENTDSVTLRFGTQNTIPCLGEGREVLQKFFKTKEYYFHGTPRLIVGNAIHPHVPDYKGTNTSCTHPQTGESGEATLGRVWASPSPDSAIWQADMGALKHLGMVGFGATVDEKENNGRKTLIYNFTAEEPAKKALQEFADDGHKVYVYICRKEDFTATRKHGDEGLILPGHRVSYEDVRPIGYVIVDPLKDFTRPLDVSKFPPACHPLDALPEDLLKPEARIEIESF